MSHDVNILVNGSRCKQYHHDGKIFIEAKDGSEYTIEIKNNEWTRILAVCSVDGLDVLNGKTAKEDNNGYVINALSSLKIDGFRVSNDQVAKFIFGAKRDSYAASKGNGSERNVGVIGVRLFAEKVKYVPPVIREEHHHHHYPRPSYPPYNPYPIWCDTTYSTSIGSDTLRGNTLGDVDDCCLYDNDAIPTKGGDTVKSSTATYGSKCFSGGGTRARSFTGGQSLRGMSFCSNQVKAASFDMGTEWGSAKESRVVEVEFEKGLLTLSTNIYYASRQSLIEMGIPLGNEKQVSFPEPFADSKYAQPPKNWVRG